MYQHQLAVLKYRNPVNALQRKPHKFINAWVASSQGALRWMMAAPCSSNSFFDSHIC